MNKIFADLAGKHRSPLTDHLFRNFRRDVDGYVIVDPVFCISPMMSESR